MSTVPLDMYVINREMDKVKVRTFLGKNAAFFGPLMCNLNFAWNEGIPTAATDSVDLEWNPHFFSALPEATRETVLRHELEHVARLHGLRMGSRDPKIWNKACDHRINIDLENEGYSFAGIEWACKDQRFGDKSEEEIYIILKAEHEQDPNKKGPPDPLAGDLKPIKEGAKHQAVANVVRAVQQAKATGKASDVPGHLEVTISDFLAPVLDPRVLLQRFFTELGDMIYTLRRPNRRFQDVYMPSTQPDMDRLGHLMYFLDISGSISDHEIKRFNSEVKHIKDSFNPERLTIVTFDTRICDVIEITENDHFDKITVTGRGGTSLRPVREMIIKHQPTAVMIFTDLRCEPMKRLPKEVPVIWVVSGNARASTKFGQIIHLPPEKQ